ncbi:MAG TPA: prolyl oligopeptidase family serine peptidase [Longimicrobiaceae bacterium]|nr:prolyl oligopeptidase family serine peptidase [Longimicrobiaceae bacterium]
MTRRSLSVAVRAAAGILVVPGALAAQATQTAPAPAARQPAGAPFALTVENIMRGPLLVGRSPDEVRWSADSRWIYFRWRRPEAVADTTTHVYRVAASGGEPVLMADSAAWRGAPAVQGEWSADRRARAEVRGGDVYVTGRDGRERRVTQTPTRESGAHLSADGRTVYFTSGGNLYAVGVDGGTIRQLTDLRTADAPKKDETTGQRGYLRAQQDTLFQVIRDRATEKTHRDQVDSLQNAVRPVYLGKGVTLGSARVSPSGRYALLETTSAADGEREAIVPRWVTETGFTEPMNIRSKVGDVQEGQRVAMLDLATSRLTWVEPEGTKDRKLLASAIGWAPDRDLALVIGVPLAYKDRWIYVVDPAGHATVVDALHDDAWVGDPGLFSAGWVPNAPQPRVWFISDRTGYSHLYTVAATGGAATAVTSGTWEVTDAQPADDGRSFWITTGETHPGERALYSVPVGGGARTRITRLDGWNESLVSPDGRMVATLHSTGNEPPELYVGPARPGAAARRVTSSTTAEFRQGPWIKPEVVTYAARDGKTVYARIYRPADLGARSNGAAVLFVHGAGYLQNAHRGWSTYFREYMFNHLLASRGYTVLDVDYRGSAGYGREWRTGIYRHMGGKDLDDEVDGARWLVQHEGVDAGRIGLYGGSYGGFITLMGLFTQPDVFRSGAALRSVTDWAHYNHWYTSRILNQPQDDPQAYRQSSPIYFAEGLRGDLLIAHGMVDTNVHFQDVVRLSQRLIELHKKNWELAVYPVEDHAFTRPDSWTDEYSRILKLFERTLPPGSPPPAQ